MNGFSSRRLEKGNVPDFKKNKIKELGKFSQPGIIIDHNCVTFSSWFLSISSRSQHGFVKNKLSQTRTISFFDM